MQPRKPSKPSKPLLMVDPRPSKLKNTIKVTTVKKSISTKPGLKKPVIKTTAPTKGIMKPMKKKVI
jgi:hypothetical protein